MFLFIIFLNRWNLVIQWLVLGSALFCGIDLISKYVARAYLTAGSKTTFIPYFIDFSLIYNSGFSFGLFGHEGNYWGWLATSAVTVFSLGYVGFVVCRNFFQFSKLQFFCLALLFGGALGNALERVFFQKVTDFMVIKFFGYPLFVNNLADDFISFSILLLLLSYVFAPKKKARLLPPHA